LVSIILWRITIHLITIEAHVRSLLCVRVAIKRTVSILRYEPLLLLIDAITIVRNNWTFNICLIHWVISFILICCNTVIDHLVRVRRCGICSIYISKMVWTLVKIAIFLLLLLSWNSVRILLFLHFGLTLKKT
jgi:hypothetical protein